MSLPVQAIPQFLRLKDLRDRGIVSTHQAVRHMQRKQSFPAGRLLGARTRVWTVEEITQWLGARPTKRKDLKKL
jgi:predicted DNA-binding transcriptional regulator AlpA